MTTSDLFDPSLATRGTQPTLGDRLRRLWAAHKRRREQRRTIVELTRLDDHLLRDIGIERQDVIDALTGRRAPSILFTPMRRQADHR